MRWLLVMVVLSVGCATPPARHSIEPPAAASTVEAAPWAFRPSGREPLSLLAGDRHLVVKWASPKPIGPATLVESLTVDGVVVFPIDCSTPGPLCTPAHEAMRDEHGSMADVVRVRATADRIDLVIAAVFRGSPECGAYGYYVLRIDALGVRASAPVRGCFVSVSEGEPRVEVGPPLRVKTLDSGVTFERVTMTLDEDALDFAVTRKPV